MGDLDIEAIDVMFCASMKQIHSTKEKIYISLLLSILSYINVIVNWFDVSK